MAVTETIQELLQGIADAQYGRDMREFIRKAIQKCYEEGSAGETDLEARESIEKILEIFGDVESTSTASKAYSIGDSLIYDGHLYRVTQAISQGDTISVGGNIAETTVASATITPPDFSKWERYRALPSAYSAVETFRKTGWYSLSIAKTNGQNEIVSAYIAVRDATDSSWIPITHIQFPQTTNNIHYISPWLYFKEGSSAQITCSGGSIDLCYCPCL